MGGAWVTIGVAVCAVDIAIRRVRRATGGRTPVVQQTGRVASRERVPEVSGSVEGVRYVEYPGMFGQSLWRSQELSLFHELRGTLQQPCLDFGCGDGSFGLAALGQVRCGVDLDFGALTSARRSHAYELSVCANGSRLPFGDATFRSIIANSVLEHSDDPRAILREFRRVLTVDGTLAFSVPTAHYTQTVRKYLGEDESRYRDWLHGHRHMHDVDWWSDALREAGFTVQASRLHAPDWFTFTYLVMSSGLGSRVLRWFGGSSTRYRSLASRMIRASIAGAPQGANVFIVARAES